MLESPANTQPNQREGTFEAHATRIMFGLQSAVLGLIEGLPQAATRAADLEKALGVSHTLGWQIHRLATTPNPMEIGLRVPGGAAVRQALRGARSAGVSEDRIERVNAAMAEFECMVERHAGDRATFETMIGGLAGNNVEAIDVKTRRQAFRVHSQVWGVQVKTHLSCTVMMPGATSELMDLAYIFGMHDVCRLRTGVPLPVMGQRIMDNHGQALAPSIGQGEALSEGAGPVLLREFCSEPLPELETRVQDGTMTVLLRESPVGNTGARSVFMANMSRGLRWNLHAESGQPDHDNIACFRITKPTEMLVMDVLMHRDMFGVLLPEASVYGSLDRPGETDPATYCKEERLPVVPVVQRFTGGHGPQATPHVPRCAEMVASVLKRIGLDPAAFDVYRCTLEYPLLHTMVQLRFDLPDRGGW